VTENDRVLRARSALWTGDLVTLGHLFNASHASMRDDYEVSVPAVDRLVELAESEPPVFGARMTGGGFGGAVVIAAAAGSGAAVASRVRSAYAAATGHHATILMPAAVV
jgi:galactokinase